MRASILIRIGPAAALLFACAAAGQNELAPSDRPHRAVLEGYAGHAWELYSSLTEHTTQLAERIRALVEQPSPETLADAREAWLAGRALYGTSEVYRFTEGPIDDARLGLETLINAWPIDEAGIDYVAEDPTAGIINSPERFPYLEPELLTLWNQRGGETNVTLGWHAIEFLLWGQDTDPNGPGARSHLDYSPGDAPHAKRRGRYLILCAEALVDHLTIVRDAWAPDAENYRAEFLAKTEQRALRDVIAGMTILSGFELSGERLAVAFETRDQEEEHSCFSDNTIADLRANQLGILALYRGPGEAPGLRAIARADAPDLVSELDARLEASLAAIEAIPAPFDRAITAADGTKERLAVERALIALERQTETLASLALALGYEIGLHPGG